MACDADDDVDDEAVCLNQAQITPDVYRSLPVSHCGITTAESDGMQHCPWSFTEAWVEVLAGLSVAVSEQLTSEVIANYSMWGTLAFLEIFLIFSNGIFISVLAVTSIPAKSCCLG